MSNSRAIKAEREKVISATPKISSIVFLEGVRNLARESSGFLFVIDVVSISPKAETGLDP